VKLEREVSGGEIEVSQCSKLLAHEPGGIDSAVRPREGHVHELLLCSHTSFDRILNVNVKPVQGLPEWSMVLWDDFPFT